jgi:iron(III) transport system substrate-binding protein
MLNGKWMKTLSIVVFTFSISHFPFSIARADVTLYTSIDQPYAAPIVREFEKKTGVHVILVTDAEATKSVGLAERVRAEKANPQCDVFWSNEPFHTINLAAEGLLQQYDSPAAKDVPDVFKDPEHRWAGNALRARVLAFHSDKPDATFPGASINDLLKPEMRGKVALARPTAGTTGGHVAALYVLWGDERADKFFQQLRGNGMKLLGGNGPVADAVGRGAMKIGLTDNDDVASAHREGGKIVGVLPDQDSFGTLMIPTTVGLVTGAPHAEEAKKLIDHLLSREVEQSLLDAHFAGWSVREMEKSKVKAMAVDYREVAKAMPKAVRKATAILEGRE